MPLLISDTFKLPLPPKTSLAATRSELSMKPSMDESWAASNSTESTAKLIEGLLAAGMESSRPIRGTDTWGWVDSWAAM